MQNSPVDLTNCDREPIHIPGSIQPHGALLVCDSGVITVLRHSANTHLLLGHLPGEELNGRTISSVFGNDVTHALRNALASSLLSKRPSLLFGMDIAGRTFDIAVHKAGSEVVIELEPVSIGVRQPLDIVRGVIGRIGAMSTIDVLVKDSARLIRATLGYDRVMIYRFEEDGAGQVISEAKSAHLESFQGQYFPASDIPRQARVLYLQNTVRIITDASAARVPIVPALNDAGQPVDLSHAHLRSVSPIHCEYLRNMGVGASMSISIIIDGELWGLVACHHYAPKSLTMAERVAVEMFGEFFSLHLDVLRQKRRIDTANSARQALDRFLQEAPRHNDIFDLLRQSLPRFSAMLPCDGVGLWINGVWTGYGKTPPPYVIAEFAAHIGAVYDGRVWATDRLAEHVNWGCDEACDASGALAVPLSQRPRDYMFFFRREFEHTLNWAGNPNKSYDTGPLGDRLTPRKSFAIWKETVRGRSRPWMDTDLETAEAIRSALVEIVLTHNEIIVEERGRAALRQRMLNEELNHRVKNILAVIKSLVGQPNPPGGTLDEYIGVLRGRIEALAIAHDQIVRGDGGGQLISLLDAELKPYRDQIVEINLAGPSVWIDTAAYSVLALMFHELSTNSAKYGALSQPHGRLDVSWSLTDQNDCEIIWQESGGPTVKMPTRKGFGTILITRGIPHDLGGESELNYHPDGLHARFLIPAKNIARVHASGKKAPGSVITETIGRKREIPMTEIKILVVEDQMLIAIDVEMMLSDAGLNNVVTVSSAAEALKRLKDFTPTVAVLDVNLGAGTSFSVADELRRQATPFLFATGYGDSSIIPEEFAGIPVVRKPYSGKDLVAAIMGLIRE